MDCVDVGVWVCLLGEGCDFLDAIALVAVAEAVPDYQGEGGEFGCFGLAEWRWEGRGGGR